jgi:hypothetical protein
MLWFSCAISFLALATSLFSTCTLALALPTSHNVTDLHSRGDHQYGHYQHSHLVARAKKCPGGGYSPCVCPPGNGGPGAAKGIRKKKLKCPQNLEVSYQHPEDKQNGDVNVVPVSSHVLPLSPTYGRVVPLTLLSLTVQRTSRHQTMR